MKMMAVVLRPGDDLRSAIESFVMRERISAGAVIGCVGALTQARLRMAGTGRDAQDVRDFEGPFEIISLSGNVGYNEGKIRTHLHMAIAGSDGKVIGGHIKTGGNIVDITAELVIAVEDELRFMEAHDENVGWDNLVIKHSSSTGA